MSGVWGVRVGRGGGSQHPIPLHSAPSHPIPLHPIPSHPVPSPVTLSSQPGVQPRHEPCFQVNIIFFPPAFPFPSRFLACSLPASPPSAPFNLSKHFISHKYTRMSLDQSE